MGEWGKCENSVTKTTIIYLSPLQSTDTFLNVRTFLITIINIRCKVYAKPTNEISEYLGF